MEKKPKSQRERDIEELNESGFRSFHLKDREPPNKEQVAICEEWIRKNLQPTKTIRETYSSYSYKHQVERDHRAAGHGVYISNGAFIKAMLNLGYDWKRTHLESPNAYFAAKKLAAKKIPPIHDPETMNAVQACRMIGIRQSTFQFARVADERIDRLRVAGTAAPGYPTSVFPDDSRWRRKDWAYLGSLIRPRRFGKPERFPQHFTDSE